MATCAINFTGKLDFDPAPVTSFSHKLIYLPQASDGPVAVIYEYQIDPVHAPEFMELMNQVRLIHLRNGAFSWRLHEDLTRLNTFTIEMLVPSWTQHTLQRERMTKAEKTIIDRASAFHLGAGPVEERILLCINKELSSHRRTTSHPSSTPFSPLNLGEIQETS